MKKEGLLSSDIHISFTSVHTVFSVLSYAALSASGWTCSTCPKSYIVITILHHCQLYVLGTSHALPPSRIKQKGAKEAQIASTYTALHSDNTLPKPSLNYEKDLMKWALYTHFCRCRHWGTQTLCILQLLRRGARMGSHVVRQTPRAPARQGLSLRNYLIRFFRNICFLTAGLNQSLATQPTVL